MNELLLFAVLPYVSVVLFVVMTIQRYRQHKFSYSSLSSQFLENRMHFWGSVPFHYGILFVLAGHVLAFLMPSAILSWNAAPVRLFLLEVTGLAMAILALVGLVNIVLRRRSNPKVRRVTNVADWVLYLVVGVQIVSGISVSVAHGWGSSWFATSVTPWLWSLVFLEPEVSYVASLPFAVQVHIVTAFLLIAFFPFTRLVHVLVIPNQYLWRRSQVVIWNRPRRPAGRS